MTGAQQELGQLLSEGAVVTRKPALEGLIDDIRHRIENLEGRRQGAYRSALENLVVGLSQSLRDARSADVTTGDADEFRRQWGIEKS